LARSVDGIGGETMRHLLNLLFVTGTILFILAPALGLGDVVEAITLGAALVVGGLSLVGGLIQAERSLRQIEADAQPGPRG
jgi:hypothetical protein